MKPYVSLRCIAPNGGRCGTGGGVPGDKCLKNKDLFTLFIVIGHLVELFIFEWFVQIRAHTWWSILEWFLQSILYI